MPVVSPRRQISYPNPDRSDSADVPLYIGNLVASQEQDVFFGQGALAARPTSTSGSPGIPGRIYVATDQTPHQLFWDYGTGWDAIGVPTLGGPDVPSATTVPVSASTHRITGSVTIDSISAASPQLGQTVRFLFQATVAVRHNGGGSGNIRLSGGLAAGFVAGEVLDLVFDGTNWVEHSRSARYLSGQGGIIMPGSTPATGMLAEDGSAVSRTTYAALFANQGTAFGAGDGSTTFNTADSRGRLDVGLASGGHPDVNAIGLTDGAALASRRVRHKHPFVGALATTGPESADHSHVVAAHAHGGGDHSHMSAGSNNNGGDDNSNVLVKGYNRLGDASFLRSSGPIIVAEAPGTGGRSAAHTHQVTPTGTVGPQTGSEPTDTPSYLVRAKFTRI